MIRIFLKAILIGWLSLLAMGIVTKGMALYPIHMRRWRADNQMYADCHDIVFNKEHASDCAAVFNSPPWAVRSTAAFMHSVMSEVDKCGGPCEDLFTWTNILKFILFNSAIGFQNLRKVFGYVRTRYDKYKDIQLRKKI